MMKEEGSPFILHLSNFCLRDQPPNDGSSAGRPWAHQYIQVLHGDPNSLKPSRSSCSSETPSARIWLPLLSKIGPLNTSKRVNLPASASANVCRIRARSSA